ncbi:MAG: GSCFA domain-containing protein [Methylomonas sp.]|nr:GSCFA domain-containing protein [Methylomonas sp.]
MTSTSHPYKALPDKAFWKRSVSKRQSAEVDPVGTFELRINQETKVATAGSCFAQHIARHLRNSGYKYYVVEDGHPIIPLSIREKHHYGTFSARYGNIYTARQLLQLMHRAYGHFSPQEDAWVENNGSVLDPYRPTVQPRGYISVAEMHADRAQHLAAVRKMFETLDVFVFTFGLTECWMARADGAVFPLCPGVEGGKFDPEQHVFHNQDLAEVVSDMTEFIEQLQGLNPAAQIVLTVSPVPLMATAEPGAHVLSATTYSKSVLRVAAEMLRKQFAHVHYFPSYEIIIGNFNRGRYYAEDLRSVTEEGVLHVMRLFLLHATGGAIVTKAPDSQVEVPDAYLAQAEALVEVECDEIALDR